MDSSGGLSQPPWSDDSHCIFIEESPGNLANNNKRKRENSPPRMLGKADIAYPSYQNVFSVQTSGQHRTFKRSKAQLENRKIIEKISPCIPCRMDQKGVGAFLVLAILPGSL